MVQNCKVLYSRKQWKKKAVHRGLKVREMRKTLNRKNEQIEQLKTQLAHQRNPSVSPPEQQRSPEPQRAETHSFKKKV